MRNQIYLYPIWVRIWHLLNTLLFLALILTGLSLQYSSKVYSLIRFDWAISTHNIGGIILCVVYVFFLFANRFTSNGNYYQFHISGLFHRVLKQFRFYSIGIFKKEEPPFPISIDRKFNPLQKISYVIIMYLFMPIVIGTGLGLFFPDILPSRLFGTSGIHAFDLLHIITGFTLSIFMIIHIYFCTMGKTPSANFKSMINGWH